MAWPHNVKDGRPSSIGWTELSNRADASGPPPTMMPSRFSHMLYSSFPDLHGKSICEIGTGGGGVLIAALRFLGATSGVGTDVSSSALDVARLNAEHNGVGARSEWVTGSMFEPVCGRQFDLICCNPSSMPDELLAGSHSFVYRRGGADGRDMIRELAIRSAEFLRPGGHVRFVVAGICDLRQTLQEMGNAGLGQLSIESAEAVPVTERFTKSVARREAFARGRGLQSELFRDSARGRPRWFEMRYVIGGRLGSGASEHIDIADLHRRSIAAAYRSAGVSPPCVTLRSREPG